jgi:predicted permease
MHLSHDLRYAFRLIRQNWAFSATVILILALCIGANTAVLSVVNAALVKPLSYPHPENLAQVVTMFRSEGAGNFGEWQTGGTWEGIRDDVTALEAAVYKDASDGVNFSAGNSVNYLQQQRVCAGFFHVLGVAPLVGREFNADEDRPGGAPVVILSHSLWTKYFNADPGVVGRGILLRGEPYTVTGIMPAGFRSSVSADLWTPIRPSRKGEGGGTNYAIIARLKPGASWQQANSQLTVLTAELKHDRVFEYQEGQLEIVPLLEGMTSGLRQPLLLLWAAVALVFVLGCVNIGSMLLARSSGRAAEIATRLALGAPLSRILRQLLVESLVLGLAGGAAGALAGWGGLYALRSLGAHSFSFLETVELDVRVLAATLALAIVAALVSGLMPAWQAARVDLRSAQSAGSRSVAGGRRFLSMGALAGGQIALTVPLLLGAGLLLRTFIHLWTLNAGFDGAHVLAARFSLQDARYNTSEKMNALFDRTLERLRQTPGIESAAVGLSLPYERWLNMGMRIPSSPKARDGNITNLNYVTPDFFAALRIPLRRGRVFTAADTAASARVVIASEAFVRTYFGGDDPLGQPMFVGGNNVVVVGIVGDLQQRPGWGPSTPLAQVPALYIPASQTTDGFLKLIHTWFAPNWVVRGSAGSAAAGTSALRRAIADAANASDPMLPMASFRNMDELKGDALTFQRFLVVLVGAVALLAAILAALGIYGLIANLVAERTRELGIRMALGSSVSGAVQVALRPGLRWVAGGFVVGAAVAFSLEKLLRSFLWGVSASDPVTLVAVAVGVLLATAVASVGPALRIASLKPADTLRAD